MIKNKELPSISTKLIVRKSVVVLGVNLVTLEFLFLIIFFLRFPFYFFNLSNQGLSILFTINTLALIIYFVTKVFFVIFATLRFINNYYEIGPEEIISKSGIFSHKERTFYLKNVDSVTINQSFWGKMLNYGTVRLFNPVLNQYFWLKTSQTQVKDTNLSRTCLSMNQKRQRWF